MREKVDTLRILVSCNGKEQLISGRKLPSGTGKTIAEAVVADVQEWGIENKIEAMSFDNMATNTSYKSGVCVLVQVQFDRDLLHLACRHHMVELVLKQAFQDTDIAPSTGQDIPLFKRFQAKWPFVKQKAYQTAGDDEIDPFKNEIVQFAETAFKNQQPRHDYRYFFELAIIYLRGNS